MDSDRFSAVLMVAGWTGVGCAGGMNDLIAGAKKEGTIKFYPPSSFIRKALNSWAAPKLKVRAQQKWDSALFRIRFKEQ
jgi:hypothetical protein